jgi:hypothetical protein
MRCAKRASEGCSFVAVHGELHAGSVGNGIPGLEELIEALFRSDERAIESYVSRRMQGAAMQETSLHR